MKAVIVTLAMAMSAVAVQGRYGGGSGRTDDPYLIDTAGQMNEIGLHEEDWDKHFKLTADISLAAYQGMAFNLIGRRGVIGRPAALEADRPFTGVFDGNRHIISSFTYDCNTEGPAALFRYVAGPNAQIRDLGLIDPKVRAEAGSEVGSLVGLLGDGTVANCYVEGGSVEGEGSVGGLVGSSNRGIIIDSHFSGRVSGSYGAGGLVGVNNDGTILNCSARADVAGDGRLGGLAGHNVIRDPAGTIANCCSDGSVSGGGYVGGLVGLNECYAKSPTAIRNSYSSGSAFGDWAVGGLVGGNIMMVAPVGIPVGPPPFAPYSMASIAEASVVAIRNCYATGSVVGDERVGGLVGEGRAQWVEASFWDRETSGQTISGGGVGLSTSEMKTPSTFSDAGWDLMDETKDGTEDIWWILEGQDYPKLWWQYGRILCPYPRDGAVDVVQPITLNWAREGPALDHDVYFGEDRDEVADATPDSSNIYRGRQPAQVTSYAPGALEWGRTYFWRVDAVDENDPRSPWKGNVWSFTTADFIVIDDFESYDDDCNRIFYTWRDGLGHGDDSFCVVAAFAGNNTGCLVGHLLTPYVEQPFVVHSGHQSMPYHYDNDGTVFEGLSYERSGTEYYSEAERWWMTPQDWTAGNTQALTLWLCGLADNSAEPLYVAVEDSAGRVAAVVNPDPNAVLVHRWVEWRIPLHDFTGVNPAAITKMCIGVGNRKNPQPGGTGLIYIDDIRLTKRMP